MPSAPVDFALPAHDEQVFRLSEHRGQPVVIYFYPRDNTPGCTTEAQNFRDLHTEFRHLNCLVIGISRDSLKSHAGFAEKHALPFPLLSDSEELVCKQFGVIKLKNLYGKQVLGIERSTFLLDANGAIVHEWRGVKVAGHASEVLAAVTKLCR